MKIKVIVFDLDDTLYDEIEYVKSCFKEVSNYFSYKFKIDKSLSDNFLNLDSKDVMDALISLGHHLKLEITAEGIESTEQYLKLKESGCDYIQGYLFSKPLPASEIENIYYDNLVETVLDQ